jgi:drug/metabolite transporter (DMT)-like permease
MVGWSPVELDGPTVLAVLAMLGGSASYAAAGIYARRALRGVSTHALALGQQLGALVWLVLPGLAFFPRAMPSPAASWSLAALGVLSTGVAYLLYFRLLARVGPTGTSTVTYLLPVVGMFWGALLLDEPVTAGMLAGLAIVLGSVVLVNDVRLTAPERQSDRSTTAGSIREARRAGNHPASAPTPASTATASTIVSGSCGARP